MRHASKNKHIAPIRDTAPRVPTNKVGTKEPQNITQQHDIGTNIYKTFNNAVHKGTVRAYDTTHGFYEIEYDDGDEEEMTNNEV